MMFSRDVSTSVTGTDSPSRVTVGCSNGGLTLGGWGPGSAHVRNSASVDSISSNVLHSTVDATNILVPGFTVHDLTPAGPKRCNRAAEVKARKSDGRG